MKELNSNNIAKFLEIFVDSGVKLVDELDLFKDDGVFASLPYGKIVNFITKKIVQISDPNVALKKAIALSISYNLLIAVKKNNISIKIDEQLFYQSLEKIKLELEKITVDVEKFNIDDFFSNESIMVYSEKLNEIFDKYFSESQNRKIKLYRSNYLIIDFFKVLEYHSLAYEKLQKIFNNRSHEEYIKLNKKLKYQNRLIDMFNSVVLNDEAGMTLADIYIEPYFKIHEYCISGIDKNSNNYGRGTFKKVMDNTIHSFMYDWLDNLPIEEPILRKDSNLFFILGYPGQGKSSFCKKMIYDFYSTKMFSERNVVFIKIRNITDTLSLINNPFDTLYDHWTLEYEIDNAYNKKDFQSSLLILDGLDELFMKENLPQRAIDEFCKVMVRETENKKNLKVIITSRYGYINLDNLKRTHALIVQLDEFDENQQNEWLKRYLLFHPETNLSPNDIKKYNNDITFEPIKELITQPILLHLIATLNQEVTTEMNKAMIYDRLFTELINRSWAKEGQIDLLKTLEKEDLREFIRDIAYAIFLSGREYIHKSVLVSLPETRSFIAKLDTNEQMQDVLKNIMIAFYFQETKKTKEDKVEEERNDYAIEFLHKSLQEYLVAEKIWERLLEFIDKDSRRGKYLVDSTESSLNIINDLFSEQYLPEEIHLNLFEIINNANFNDREEISKRLELFFPKWLEHDIVNKFEWGKDNFYEKESLIYYNLFHIMTRLVDGKKYINNNFSFLSGRSLSICLKDQTLEGSLKVVGVSSQFEEDEIPIDIFNSYLDSVGFDSTNEKVYKFLFDSISMLDFRFRHRDPAAIGEFRNCHIFNSEFLNRFSSSPNKLTFNDCKIRRTVFDSGHFVFNKGIITDSSFSIGMFYEFNDCKFEKSIFYLDNPRVSYTNSIFKDCEFKNCVIYISTKFKDIFANENKIFGCAFIYMDDSIGIPSKDLPILDDEGLK